MKLEDVGTKNHTLRRASCTQRSRRFSPLLKTCKTAWTCFSVDLPDETVGEKGRFCTMVVLPENWTVKIHIIHKACYKHLQDYIVEKVVFFNLNIKFRRHKTRAKKLKLSLSKGDKNPGNTRCIPHLHHHCTTIITSIIYSLTKHWS